MYIRQYQTVSIMARTLLTLTTGQTQGWSFSLQYDNSYQTYYGGTMSATAVTTTGTQTTTVQNGAPPDINETAIRSGYKGYTQGIVIDTNQVYTLAPSSDFVTSKACFSITASGNIATYPIYLKLTHEIGNPKIRTVITQSAQSTVPCAQNFTLNVNVNYYITTPGACNISGAGPMAGPTGPKSDPPAGGLPPAEEAGPAGGPGCPANCPQFILKDFRRGDANASAVVDLSDVIFILGYLFTSGTAPACLNTADANDDEQIDISDPVFLLFFLFVGGAPPPDPFDLCGPDRTPLPSGICAERNLNCLAYPNPPCSQSDTDQDGLTNFFESRLGSNPNDSDHDNDGVTDGQEVLVYQTTPLKKDHDGDLFEDGQELGFSTVPGCQGESLNICSVGADPNYKDIFVEIDWMETGGISERPPDTALDLVVQSFARKGIRLHLDTGIAPYNLGNSDNKIPHNTAAIPWNPDTTGAYSIYGQKRAHFDPERCKVSNVRPFRISVTNHRRVEVS